MTNAIALPYLQAYPPSLQQQAAGLLQSGKLGDWLLARHPAAVGEVGGCAVPARQLCAHRTAADLTQAGNSLRKEALQSPLIVDSLSRREGGK